MKIEGHLRKYGYRPELSDGILDKYEVALCRYLGDEKYKEFFDLRVHKNVNNWENELFDYIGDDLRFLKIAFSSQLRISIEILNKIIQVLKNRNIKPKAILELGGADGWAIDYLNKRFNWSASMTLVDKHERWKPHNPQITIYRQDYAHFNSQEKYSLVFSILGGNFNMLEEFLNCVSRNMADGGLALLGLRISSDLEYVSFVKVIHALGLKINIIDSQRIPVFDENIPFIVLEKSPSESQIGESSPNEILSIVRSCFHGFDAIKRVYGFEAYIMADLIKDGNQISTEEKDWDNGDHFELEVLEKNGILYRKTSNHRGDLLIEFPVDKEDPSNILGNQIARMHQKDIWNTTR